MILIGLGANLPSQYGGPVETLEAALAHLDEAPGIEIAKRSNWYASAPLGMEDQPDFVNGVVLVETKLMPLELLQVLLDLESQFGRQRTLRWGPRLLDLDIIDFDGQIEDLSNEGLSLHLPHPRAHERAFVLQPVAEIAPDWRHPSLGRTAKELLSHLAGEQKVELL